MNRLSIDSQLQVSHNAEDNHSDILKDENYKGTKHLLTLQKIFNFTSEITFTPALANVTTCSLLVQGNKIQCITCHCHQQSFD
jgi:hypothetical protein